METLFLLASSAHADDREDGDRDDDEVEDGHSCAFFTFDTLASTPKGVTSPTTVTFFVSKSMLYDLTPAQNLIKASL